MKIKALGVNGAFTKHYHNNYVFELGNRKLLVDAGTTLRSSLPDAGYKESDITDVIITHLHSDHVGGLEEFAQRCKWIHNHKPNLWIHDELALGLNQIVNSGLCTDGLRLSDYFCVLYVREEFAINNYIIELLETENLHAQNMFSMGLKVNGLKENKNVIFTSDIAKHEEACFRGVIDRNTVALFHDVSLVKNAVHSYIEDVVDFYKDDIEPHKIFGMHYQDEINYSEYIGKYGINFAVRSGKYDF